MNSSLNNFIDEFCSHFKFNIERKIKILEIGAGSNSILLNNKIANITAIDKSLDLVLAANETENIKFKAASIQNYQSENQFDLLIDAHCLHCIIHNEDRAKAYQNIYHLLSNEGYFISETMIQPAHEKVFFKERVVKTALEIENEFIENNFKIKYFFIKLGLYFEDDDGYKNKCDVLRIVAQK